MTPEHIKRVDERIHHYFNQFHIAIGLTALIGVWVFVVYLNLCPSK